MTNLPQAPVVLFAFNRPDVTQRVFGEIRKAKPRQLFLVVDGPRNDTDSKKCDEVKAILEQVDWKCEVQRNYSETNMGCDPRVASGIDWVFQHVDRAIFFEDDCLPHPSFFLFCDELLEKYKDDKDIMHISGDNFQDGNKKFTCPESYYFSTISQSWGWATWKRAWQLMDKDMKRWPEAKEEKLFNTLFPNKAVADFWETLLQKFYDKQRINWDGQWSFACFVNSGLCVMPRVNLISNIGFGENATHTKERNHRFANLPTYPIEFPLIHPHNKVVNYVADDYTMKHFFGVNETWKQTVKWWLKYILPRPYQYLKDLRKKS